MVETDKSNVYLRPKRRYYVLIVISPKKKEGRSLFSHV